MTVALLYLVKSVHMPYKSIIMSKSKVHSWFNREWIRLVYRQRPGLCSLMINMLTCINCGTNVGARLAGWLFQVSWKFRTVSQILKAITVQERVLQGFEGCNCLHRVYFDNGRKLNTKRSLTSFESNWLRTASSSRRILHRIEDCAWNGFFDNLLILEC